jgi:hypothetical protein
VEDGDPVVVVATSIRTSIVVAVIIVGGDCDIDIGGGNDDDDIVSRRSVLWVHRSRMRHRDASGFDRVIIVLLPRRLDKEDELTLCVSVLAARLLHHKKRGKDCPSPEKMRRRVRSALLAGAASNHHPSLAHKLKERERKP